ncbi:enoyl-CoA hydratase [Caballeronia sp. M23-90]
MTDVTLRDLETSDGFKITRDANGVATLNLNNGKINILTSLIVEQIAHQLEDLITDESVRCLVVRGNDRAFIGGADIKEMAELDPESARVFITRLYKLCAAVRVAPFPVIARIHGWCFGVGAELAAACDIRIASTASWYAMPEVKIGIPSVIQATLLPQLIGTGRMRWWVLTGRRIDAKTALEWGYLNEVVKVEKLDETVAAVTSEICECPPNAIRIQKRLCNDWEADFPDNAARASIGGFASTYETDEPLNAMRKFLARKQ